MIAESTAKGVELRSERCPEGHSIGQYRAGLGYDSYENERPVRSDAKWCSPGSSVEILRQTLNVLASHSRT